MKYSVANTEYLNICGRITAGSIPMCSEQPAALLTPTMWMVLVSHMVLIMGDSRICSRGFLEVVLHGTLARRKIFHYYNTHFSYALVMIHNSKGFSKGHLIS